MDRKIGLFDAIRTTRAMRRLKPDAVPDELIREILQAATCAPSGGDAQHWRFIVVKDPEIKKQIQIRYQRAYDDLKDRFHAAPPPPGKTEAQKQRMLAARDHLTRHFHEAPVLIVCCLYGDSGSGVGAGASIYPAVQNILLAARALGLGATLTTRHLLYEREVDQLLGLPEEAQSFAIVPIGYPLGHFGPVSRAPVEQVTFLDRWGGKYP
ncbi:MAG TPA: nitroreductase family protein [Candidatus Binataceae bacterium]|nr:nitroreductase family protein [Candidatus Binataceae bacterium]